MHTRTVILEERLGHEGNGLSEPCSHVLGDILIQHHLVGHVHKRVEEHIDLGLAAGGDLVMMGFDGDSALLKNCHHFRTDVLTLVGRRKRKVSFLKANLMAQVVGIIVASVPDAFCAVHVVMRAVDGLVVSGVVEDEKLRLGAEAGCVGDTALGQIRLALATDGPGIPAVFLEVDGAFDVAD